MKLRDALNNNTNNINEGKAADAAHKIGLVSKGLGRWADKTGKVVAKSVGDKLHKIGGKLSSNKTTKNKPSFNSRGSSDYFSDEEMAREINKQKNQRKNRSQARGRVASGDVDKIYKNE